MLIYLNNFFFLIKRVFFIFILFFFINLYCFSKNSYRLNDIVFKGINNNTILVCKKKIFNNIGNVIYKNDFSKIIQILFKTNKFNFINVYNNNNKLYIYLKKKREIWDILVKGNKLFSNIYIFNELKRFGIFKKNEFNFYNFLKFKKFLLNKYKNYGKYFTKIYFNKIKFKNNFITLIVNIKESDFINIKNILYSGFNFIKKEDIYNFLNFNYYFNNLFVEKFKLNNFIMNLINLKLYYINHGYINFNFNKLVVKILNNKNVFIYIKVKEGPRYKISNLIINSDIKKYNFIIDKIKKKYFFINNYYNIKFLEKIIFEIKNFYKNKGYYDVKINILNVIKKNTIDVILKVDSGKIFFIRKIKFLINKDNINLNNILPKDIINLKGNKYQKFFIEKYKKKLYDTGFFENIFVNFKKIGSNKLDVFYNLNINNDKIIKFGVDFKNKNINLNLILSKSHFLRLGDNFLFKINKNYLNSLYYFSLFYPIDYKNKIFYKYKFSYLKNNNKNNLDNLNIIKNTFNIKNSLIYLLNNYFKCILGINYLYNDVFIKNNHFILKYLNNIDKNNLFVLKNNFTLQDFFLFNNLTFNNLNNKYLPLYGTYINFNNKITILKSFNNYYKSTLIFNKYLPLDKNKNWILFFNFYLNYGKSFNNKQYPFYEYFILNKNNILHNYNFLNFKNKEWSSLNKEFILFLGTELIVPNKVFFLKNYYKYFRISLFLDNFYINYNKNVIFKNYSQHRDNLWLNLNKDIFKDVRISCGLSFKLFTPFGPINISYGYPLKKNFKDKFSYFQFSLSNY